MGSGTLHLGGDYNQTAGGKLEIELASLATHDALEVTGMANLAGTLAVTLINGFTPQAGQAFDILDWGGLTGTFTSLVLPALPGSLAWDASQLYTTGVLAVASAGVSGDFNLDGQVDGSDFVMWQRGLGSPYTVGDLSAWKSHFGANADGPTASRVPEPAGAWLAILAAAASLIQSRHLVHLVG
jgi:hypothetical protein